MSLLLPIAICFALGDAAALCYLVPLQVWVFFILLGSIGMWVNSGSIGMWLSSGEKKLSGVRILLKARKHLLNCIQYFFGLGIFIFSLVFALGCGGLVGLRAQAPWQQEIKKLYNRPKIFSGEIIPGTVKNHEYGYVTFTVECRQTDFKIQVRAKHWPRERQVPFAGSIRVQGKLEPIKGFSNPGMASQELLNKIENKIGCLDLEASAVKTGPAQKDLRYYGAIVSKKMQALLRQAMSEEDSAFLTGMVLGDKGKMDSEILRKFSLTGLSHLLAVSGTHVAILAGFALTIFKVLGLSERQSLLPTGVFMLAYILLCGPKPPIMRAVAMGIALLLGKAMDRQEDKGAVWAGTLIILLSLCPWWVLSCGFQLSFLATAGLIFLEQPLNLFLQKFFPSGVANLLAVSVAAQLPMVPALVHHFHNMSLLSPLANLLVIPLLSPVLMLTMLGLLLSLVVPLIGKIFLLPAAQLLGVALGLIKILAAVPGATCSVGKIPGFIWIFYYIFLGALFDFFPIKEKFSDGEKIKIKKTICTVCFATFFLVLICHKLWPQPFRAYFLDVGQGDCALVLTPSGESIMIDTGGLTGDFDVGERIILPVLRYLEVGKIDVLLLTHGHHDHAGGAASLARAMPIKKVLVPCGDKSRDLDRLWSELATQCTNNDTQKIVYKIQKNKIFTLGDCIIRIVGSPSLPIEPNTGNEYSLLAEVRHKGNSLLFTGDATGEMELKALKTGALSHDVLKISHHGSNSSSEEDFLQGVNPKIAIISVGRKNKFGHPHPEVLAKLEKQGIRYFRTDLDGAVKVVFDEGKLSCYSYYKEPDYF